MKLAIINLTGGGISGGHKKYLINILPALAASTKIEAILCASPSAMRAEEWLPALPKVTYERCEPFRPFRHSPDKALAALLDRFRPDLIFIPVERYIDYKGLSVVVMVQNMAPLARAKTGAGIRELLVSLARRYETKVALRRSAAVIVPTEYVKKFIEEKAGVPKNKVTAIHYGGNAAPSAALKPAGFPFKQKDFIFTAGSIEAYRGLEDLVRALPEVKKKHLGMKLAVAGASRLATTKYFESLKELAADLQVSADIAWLGNIPEGELSWCYANCAAFALTSRVESFCFVALEAMAHGCRIVSSDSPCLPEILGDTAVYYKAGNVPALSAGLLQVLSAGPRDGDVASSAALERAAGFSWGKAASATLDVFIRTLP